MKSLVDNLNYFTCEYAPVEKCHYSQLINNAGDKVGLEIVSASPGYVTVSHGGSTLLTCVAQGPQSVHYHWLRDGNPISEQGIIATAITASVLVGV